MRISIRKFIESKKKLLTQFNQLQLSFHATILSTFLKNLEAKDISSIEDVAELARSFDASILNLSVEHKYYFHRLTISFVIK